MGRPFASKNDVLVAYRGRSGRPTRSGIMPVRSGPEMRTTPIAPRPGAVAMAAIMSGLATGGLPVLQCPRDVPLLRDRQNIIHQPVQHETRWEEEKEDAKCNRHDLH